MQIFETVTLMTRLLMYYYSKKYPAFQVLGVKITYSNKTYAGALIQRMYFINISIEMMKSLNAVELIYAVQADIPFLSKTFQEDL